MIQYCSLLYTVACLHVVNINTLVHPVVNSDLVHSPRQLQFQLITGWTQLTKNLTNYYD